VRRVKLILFPLQQKVFYNAYYLYLNTYFAVPYKGTEWNRTYAPTAGFAAEKVIHRNLPGTCAWQGWVWRKLQSWLWGEGMMELGREEKSSVTRICLELSLSWIYP
jgi:hypothetical protein